VGDIRPATFAKSSENSLISFSGAAESAEVDPDLVIVIGAWPLLNRLFQVHHHRDSSQVDKSQPIQIAVVQAGLGNFGGNPKKH
jgi:hypothetical protein